MNRAPGFLMNLFTFMSILFFQTLAEAADDENLEVVEAFKKDCAQLAEKAGALTVVGDDGWLFSKNELRHLSVGQFWGKLSGKVSRARNVNRRDPLPAIIDFNEKLEGLGIELIFLPIPANLFWIISE